MPERVRVVVRVRPYIAVTDGEDTSIATVIDSNNSGSDNNKTDAENTNNGNNDNSNNKKGSAMRVRVGEQRVFVVDHAYDMHASNAQVYEEQVRPLVQDVLRGYNATVMAYGQTGTGKTYTMRALTPLVLRDMVQRGFAGETSMLSVQYVEVYGETLRDLFSAQPQQSSKSMQLYDHTAVVAAAAATAGMHDKADADDDDNGDDDGGGVAGYTLLRGATRLRATTLQELLRVIDAGAALRATAATDMSAHSSRSHSILCIHNHRDGCKLNLVDLAGSERNKRTHNTGTRLLESIGINSGLLALGNVMRALCRNHYHSSNCGGCDKAAVSRATSPTSCPPSPSAWSHTTAATAAAAATHTQPQHVPYRSSKLTRLLHDALGGNSKTLFIACVAPNADNARETMRTLQYCALAMRVVNEPMACHARLYGHAAAAARQQRQQREQQQQRRRSGSVGVAARSRSVSAGVRMRSRSTSPLAPAVHVQSPSWSLCGSVDEATTAAAAATAATTTRAALMADKNALIAQLQARCREQAVCVDDLRRRLADAEARWRACADELRADRAVFARQLTSLQPLCDDRARLLARVQELEQRVAQLSSSAVSSSSMSTASTTTTALRASRSLRTSHKRATLRSNSNNSDSCCNITHDGSSRHGATDEHTDDVVSTAVGDDDGMVSMPTMTTTMMATTAGMSTAATRSPPWRLAALPRLPTPLRLSSSPPHPHDVDTSSTTATTTTMTATGEPLSLTSPWCAQDEQMASLARQAVHYHNANAQLRNRLRSAAALLHEQRRESALLRVELDEARRLLQTLQATSPRYGAAAAAAAHVTRTTTRSEAAAAVDDASCADDEEAAIVVVAPTKRMVLQ